MTERTSQAATPRRIGRPSVRDERQAQIYDAVEACLFELGLARTTLEAIARRAGVSRSAIAHFVGNRDDVIDAAIARSAERFVDMMHSIVADAPPDQRLDVFVAATIEPREESIRMITVLNEVIAHAHRDAHARDEIRRAFVGLQAFVEDLTAARFPDAPAADRATVATGLIYLLREFDRVRTLEATDRPQEQARQVQAAAELLIASLEHS